MELEFRVRVESFDVMDGSLQTETARRREVRVQHLHEGSQLLSVSLSLLHVADGQVDGDEHTKVTVVSVLCVSVGGGGGGRE